MSGKLEARNGQIDPHVIHCGRCGRELGEILDLRGWDLRSDPPAHVNLRLFDKVSFRAGPLPALVICIPPGYVRKMNADGIMEYSLIKRALKSLRSGLWPAAYRRGNMGSKQGWLMIEKLPAKVQCPCPSSNWLRAKLFALLPLVTD